jgi:hypothetical protein
MVSADRVPCELDYYYSYDCYTHASLCDSTYVRTRVQRPQGRTYRSSRATAKNPLRVV